MSSQQPPPTPRQRKVQAALDLFAQLQGAPFVIGDDEQRVRHAANLHREATSSSAAAAVTAGPSSSGSGQPPANMLRKGTGAGGGAAPSLQTTRQLQAQIAELQKKLIVSDALMKKLHRRNRDLQSELDEVKGSGGGEGGAASGGGNNSSKKEQQKGGSAPHGVPTSSSSASTSGPLTNEQLQSIIVKRDQEIMALRRQLAAASQHQQQQPPATTPRLGGATSTAVGASPSPAEPAAVSPSRPNTNKSTTSVSVGRGGGGDIGAGGIVPKKNVIVLPTNAPAEAHVALLHQRIDTLQRDYQTLLDSRLDAIAQGESTGRVNKQVKAFFAAVKAKIATDASDYEGERALWHQRVAFVAANYGGGGAEGRGE